MGDLAKSNAEALRSRIHKQIDDLEEQIEALREQLEGVQAFLDIYEQYDGLVLDAPASEGGINAAIEPPVVATKKPRKRPVNPPREKVVNAAVAFITAEGKPLPRAVLFRAIQSAGLDIQGKDPEMVLSTMLWRSKDKIVRLEGYGYWLADKPYPPAGYGPDDEDRDPNA